MYIVYMRWPLRFSTTWLGKWSFYIQIMKATNCGLDTPDTRITTWRFSIVDTTRGRFGVNPITQNFSPYEVDKSYCHDFSKHQNIIRMLVSYFCGIPGKNRANLLDSLSIFYLRTQNTQGFKFTSSFLVQFKTVTSECCSDCEDVADSQTKLYFGRRG